MNKSEAFKLRQQIADVLGVSGNKPFTAMTVAGPIRGRIYPVERRYKSRQWEPGWLHMRFDDGDAAFAATHGISNRFSGKYNLDYANQADVSELRRRLKLIQFREVIEQ